MLGRGRPRNTRQGDAPVALVTNRDPRDDDRNEETESDSVVWDDDFDREENPFGRRPPPQARPLNCDNVLRSLGVRVEIPDFVGAAQPDEFIDWLSTMERVFDLRDIPDHLKVKVVAITLRKLRMRFGANEEEEQVITRFLGALHQGESLVVQRVLSATVDKTVDDTLWLRNNIFRTKCTTKGKVCTVIIDGGSYDNMVAKTMVDKLELPVQDHPEPYQLTWLKKGNVVRVTQRCLVHFLIGNKYTDELWCEVIPMDACHLLLGRPWQYDRRTKHDGFRNTYSFSKDGLNNVLTPLDIRDSPANVMIVTKYEFLDYSKATAQKNLLALVVTELNNNNTDTPSLIQPLLVEFHDVFPDDIPTSLTLMREIQHCIDFLPSASIPNKPAYRMNPKEYEELHRQVTELLEKGLICESMSPCSVPALLVLKNGGAYHMCIDSRAVNKITIKYRFPIPRFEDLLDQLHGANFFLKLISVVGTIKFDCDPVTNGKQRLKRVMAYTNGCENIQQHLDHLRVVFTILREQQLFANHGKCHFLTNKVVFLGYVILGDGIQMDDTKVHAITLWPTPKTLHDFRSIFAWDDAAQKAFDELKLRVTSAPVITLPNFNEAKLNPRHTKWIELLKDFSFVIRQKAGSSNTVADALSRRHSLLTSIRLQVRGFDM
nr:hypothetical protein [Tanacetum cinerariifolium]